MVQQLRVLQEIARRGFESVENGGNPMELKKVLKRS